MSKNKYCFVNFLQEPAVNIHAKDTMAIATAANAQQDFFYTSKGHYFELAQGVGSTGANTALAAVGLTPGAGGWLLPGDNTATDSVELTRGIVSGSAQSFTIATDPAFFLRCAFLITTRANHTHLMMGFRNLAAYATANTLAESLTAYNDKACIGLRSNAGLLGSQISIATVDTAVSATHAAAADADVLALEVAISAAGVASFKVGHATPAGATYAQYETARKAALADLAADATLVGATLTTAIEHVPYIVYGMAGSAAASDTRIMSYECGLV